MGRNIPSYLNNMGKEKYSQQELGRKPSLVFYMVRNKPSYLNNKGKEIYSHQIKTKPSIVFIGAEMTPDDPK